MYFDRLSLKRKLILLLLFIVSSGQLFGASSSSAGPESEVAEAEGVSITDLILEKKIDRIKTVRCTCSGLGRVDCVVYPEYGSKRPTDVRLLKKFGRALVRQEDETKDVFWIDMEKIGLASMDGWNDFLINFSDIKKKVTMLALMGNNLEELPGSLRELESLETLLMSRNRREIKLPKSLKELPKLETVQLDSKSIEINRTLLDQLKEKGVSIWVSLGKHEGMTEY